MLLNIMKKIKKAVYTITATLTNCSGTFPETLVEGSGVSIPITVSANYYVTSEMVTVTGCDYTYSNGVLNLSNPTANIVVTITAQPRTYTISTTVTNGTYSGATSVQYGSTATVTISADSGYQLPSDVTVTNSTYTYNDTTGDIVITPIGGNVTISAVCEVVPVSGYDLTLVFAAHNYQGDGGNEIYFKLNDSPSSSSDYEYYFDTPWAGSSGALYTSDDDEVLNVGYDYGGSYTIHNVTSLAIWASYGGGDYDQVWYNTTNNFSTAISVPWDGGYTVPATFNYSENSTLYIWYNYDT